MEDISEVIVKIYELRDPRDKSCEPRYVGITTNTLHNRLRGHLKQSSLDKKLHKNNWIEKLKKLEIKPTIHLIEEVIGWEYAGEVEKYWIGEFREQGHRLTNFTEGGGGALGFKHSEETKQKMSEDKLGSKNPMYKKQFSEEHINRMIKSRSGERNGMYGRKGKDSPNYGKRHSEETKEKLRQLNLGSNSSSYGTKASNETKQKMREAHLKLPIVKCPYCNKEGRGGAMIQFHFENCKFKNINITN